MPALRNCITPEQAALLSKEELLTRYRHTVYEAGGMPAKPRGHYQATRKHDCKREIELLEAEILARMER